MGQFNRGRYRVAEYVNRTPPGLGGSDAASIQKSFPASPLGQAGDDDVITKIFMQKVMGDGGQKEYDPAFWGNAADAPDPNYGGAPNFLEVSTLNAGDPSSPYAPNIVSPTQGVDPLSKNPQAGVEAIQSLENAGIAGNGSPWPEKEGTNKPDQAAKIVSSQTLTNLQFGSSKPSGG